MPSSSWCAPRPAGLRLSDLLALLDEMDKVDWSRWFQALADDRKTYLTHTYAVEFLRHTLSSERRAWFRRELQKLDGAELARRAQQRDPSRSGAFRFTALQEKELWGDLADVFHLIYFFCNLDSGRFRRPQMGRLLESLGRLHFDAVYLAGYGTGKMDFISPEFQQLMLEIWKVKYLQMKRFREVIRSTRGVRLDHFLNDGDSPDIPIPVYVRFPKPDPRDGVSGAVTVGHPVGAGACPARGGSLRAHQQVIACPPATAPRPRP